MTLPPLVQRCHDLVLSFTGKLAWLPPLVVRLAVGVLFLRSGWGKLGNLDGVTEYFASLHIPAPHANAILAASTELVGGIALVVGLLTRLVSLPLIVTMIVAIITAKWAEVESLSGFLGLEEFLLILLLGWLAVAGAGAISLDRVLERGLSRAPRTAPQDDGAR